MTQYDSQKLIEFLELIGRLKHEKRTGWVIRDIPNCESIAGHMYRMGIMTFLLNDSSLDRLKCLQLALVHDMAECIVGDLTPFCGVEPAEKHRREDEAMKTLAALSEPVGKLLYDLYKEYETQSSPEAKFVKELDRFDMIQQAFEYEKRENTPNRLDEFFIVTEGKFFHPLITNLVQELKRQRNNHILNCHGNGENSVINNGSDKPHVQ